MKDHAMSPGTPAEWFLAIYATEEPSAEMLQAWLRWVDANDENREAFEDVVRIWHNTPAAIIGRPAQPLVEDYDGSMSIAEWRAKRQKNALPTQSAQMHVVSARRRPLFALAAAVVLIVIGGLAFRIFSPETIATGEFVTRTGEQRVLELADGSRVTLGAHSRLTVDINSGARRVSLKAGEAFFSVQKDPTRPFVVQALKGAITAIGTAFNVRAVEDRVTVTVTDGSVKVTDLHPTELEGSPPNHHKKLSRPLLEGGLLTRGQQLTYTQAKTPILESANIKRVDINESARWRDGWLVYRDEPLKYVVADIARYTDTVVKVADSAANVHFSGAVFKDNIDEWLIALPEVAAVSVERNGAGFEISSHSTDKAIR